MKKGVSGTVNIRRFRNKDFTLIFRRIRSTNDNYIANWSANAIELTDCTFLSLSQSGTLKSIQHSICAAPRSKRNFGISESIIENILRKQHASPAFNVTHYQMSACTHPPNFRRKNKVSKFNHKNRKSPQSLHIIFLH